MVGGAIIGVVALFATDGSWRSAVIGSFIAAVIGLSLVVVTGYAGQVSLAQLALAGTAAFTLSYLTQSLDIPFPFAPVLAAAGWLTPTGIEATNVQVPESMSYRATLSLVFPSGAAKPPTT